MSALATMGAIVRRDLARAFRQKSRIVGGLARPLMWLLLVGAGAWSLDALLQRRLINPHAEGQ